MKIPQLYWGIIIIFYGNTASGANTAQAIGGQGGAGTRGSSECATGGAGGSGTVTVRKITMSN